MHAISITENKPKPQNAKKNPSQITDSLAIVHGNNQWTRSLNPLENSRPLAPTQTFGGQTVGIGVGRLAANRYRHAWTFSTHTRVVKRAERAAKAKERSSDDHQAGQGSVRLALLSYIVVGGLLDAGPPGPVSIAYTI